MSSKLGADYPSEQELESLVQDVLQTARQEGASSAEAGISFGSGLNVTVRLGEVETLEYNRDRSLAVTVFKGRQKGSASTSDWSRKAIDETVAAAVAIAEHASDDPCAGLADADKMASDIPELDLCHPWDLSAEQAIELATTCEDAARQLDDRISNSEGGSIHTRGGISVYGNSHGFVGGYSATRHSCSCSVIARDEKGMQRDYWYSLARDNQDLDDVAMVGRKAAERTLQRLNSRKLKTQKVPVIFHAEVATGLFHHLVSAISGGNLYRQSSFLLDQLGQMVFPEFIQINEQPHLPKGLGSAPFDNEGVATQQRSIIEDGRLQGYFLSSYSARKLGMETTGNAGGVHNLVVQPGEQGLDDLMQQVGTGLLVTDVMGQGINIVTGDYSRGAAGFWFEGGQIQYPVEEVTIAGNLRDMFQQVVAVANDIDRRGNIHSGSVLIDKMMVAGD